VITLGRAIDGVFPTAAAGQFGYLQRLFLVTALTLIGQTLWGHRLPVISGPATVLLIGVLASSGSSGDAVYTSILVGGVFLAILAACGFLQRLRKLFTDNIVAVVLLLIALTLAPTVQRLLLDSPSGGWPSANFAFAIVLLAAMFVAHRLSTGIWRATIIVWAMLVGSPIYLLLFSDGIRNAFAAQRHGFSNPLDGWAFAPQLQIGVLVSFLVCYVALCVNDLSSIQSMNRMLNVPDSDRRVVRGIIVTGMANALSGILGVVGPVNYSLSPGIVASTGCASRWTLLPTALLVGLLAVVPNAVTFVSCVPSVVVGCVLLYILAAQVAAGLSVAFEGQGAGSFRLEDGLVIGLPILLGTIVAYLPAEALETFPQVLRPIVGNGFVVGVLAALVLEHVLFHNHASFEQ
jgi:xanthine/uracil permease